MALGPGKAPGKSQICEPVAAGAATLLLVASCESRTTGDLGTWGPGDGDGGGREAKATRGEIWTRQQGDSLGPANTHTALVYLGQALSYWGNEAKNKRRSSIHGTSAALGLGRAARYPEPAGCRSWDG